MEKKFVIICALFLMAFSIAAAEVQYANEVPAEIKEAVESYNGQISNAPDMVSGILGNENLHMFITNNKTEEFAAITNNGLIIQFGTWIDSDSDGNFDPWQEVSARPTMEVRVSINKLKEIASSEEPAKAFQEAWGNEIDYKGLNAGTKVKSLILDVGMFFFSLFN